MWKVWAFVVEKTRQETEKNKAGLPRHFEEIKH